jgi:hypothetical protein
MEGFGQLQRVGKFLGGQPQGKVVARRNRQFMVVNSLQETVKRVFEARM